MNVYSQIVSALVPYLENGLTGLGYTPLTVYAGTWKTRALPEISRYYVQVAPPPTNVWSERRISIKEVQFVTRHDIYLLVKNFNETPSLYGDGESGDDLGLFQLISDTKDLLRATSLGGLLSLTGNELIGDVTFESAASTGFETGPRTWVHRARVPFTAFSEPFCPPPPTS